MKASAACARTACTGVPARTTSRAACQCRAALLGFARFWCERMHCKLQTAVAGRRRLSCAFAQRPHGRCAVLHVTLRDPVTARACAVRTVHACSFAGWFVSAGRMGRQRKRGSEAADRSSVGIGSERLGHTRHSISA
eukprot:2776092-Rhodomonas_salina.3